MRTTAAVSIVAASFLMFAGQAGSYEVTTVANGGRVAGKVTFKGAAPEPKRLSISKDNAVCGTGVREIVEVAVTGGALSGAVVYIASIDKGKAWGALAAPMLDQQGCRFVPQVVLSQKNADLIIRNSDPVLHNIHTYEIIGAVRRTMFNIGQPDKGDMKQSLKVRRSSVVKIECDAHDFMHAWGFAADNPYVAVSSNDGTFMIADLPAGDYELKAWHPVLGEKAARISVKGGAQTDVTFEFSK